MLVTTHNHIYKVEDVGDSGYLISGHPKYCPEPTLCRLMTPLTIGECMLCHPVAKNVLVSKDFITTPILKIEE